MIEMLTYDFMQRSLLAAALVGAVCSVIGVFVVLRGLAFIGAGTAHAAFAGVALAYLLGVSPLPLAIVFGLATVWITGVMEEQGRMKLDVSIGILYTATMALAILFIGLMKGYNAEVYGYLFGSVLSVTPEELRVIGLLSLLVVGVIVVFAKELYFIAFDQDMAEASGVPARRIFYLLLTLIALTVVISLKTVGAILVFAMVLIPASTAYQLTHSLRQMTIYAVLIGTVCAVGGVMVSYWWDLPSGPAIVLLATTVFFLSVFFSPKRVRRAPAAAH
ncbi:MAG: metal ABC transporter permease [Nitrospirae bacterium]|nr:MAG: metal ABC transporter permease [Nitrospirota bacterium]